MKLNLSDEQKHMLVSIVVGALLAILAVFTGSKVAPPAPGPIVVKDIGESRFLSIMDDGRLAFTTPASKIVPGTTNLTIRDAGDTQDNFTIQNSGVVSVPGTLTLAGVAVSGPMRYGQATGVISGTLIAHGFSTTPTVAFAQVFGLPAGGASGVFSQTIFIMASNATSLTVGIVPGTMVSATVNWLAGK